MALSAIPRAPQAAPMPAPMLRVVPQSIVIGVHATDGTSVLVAAARYLSRTLVMDEGAVFRALSRREAAGSTGLGEGFAILHARLDGIAGPATLFLRTCDPVAFGAPDGAQVRNFYVIVVPTDGDPEAHLCLLASIAATFGNRLFREDLACATTAVQVEDAFRRAS